MPLTNSGQISMSDIAGEFGGSVPHQLSEYHGKGNAPASGEIQLAADFYGTANAYTIEYIVVAGGGGGLLVGDNSARPGAAGAGGLIQSSATVTAGVSMTVNVGSGAGRQSIPHHTIGRVGGTGGGSGFNSTNTSGGGGGGYVNGGSGGSGGGGGWKQEQKPTENGGTSISDQEKNGKNV